MGGLLSSFTCTRAHLIFSMDAPTVSSIVALKACLSSQACLTLASMYRNREARGCWVRPPPYRCGAILTWLNDLVMAIPAKTSPNILSKHALKTKPSMLRFWKSHRRAGISKGPSGCIEVFSTGVCWLWAADLGIWQPTLGNCDWINDYWGLCSAQHVQ